MLLICSRLLFLSFTNFRVLFSDCLEFFLNSTNVGKNTKRVGPTVLCSKTTDWLVTFLYSGAGASKFLTCFAVLGVGAKCYCFLVVGFGLFALSTLVYNQTSQVFFGFES